MFDVISIGSGTRDVFARAREFDVHASSHAVSGFEGCLPLGAKVEVQELDFDTGGGATNTAFSFAKLGLKSAAVCRVGNDIAGKEIIRVLRKAHVDTRFITVDRKERTAYSIILLVKRGERTILVYRGASAHLNEASIPWNKLFSRWLYISSLGGNLTLFKRLLLIAKKRNIKVAWNPGGEELKQGLKKLGPYCKEVDVLIMNEEEAEKLAHDDLGGALNALRPRPGKALAITQGRRGAIVSDGKSAVYAPAYGKKVVNTTGAGDAFSSGFLAGLIHFKYLSLALRLGIMNSGLCVTPTGAKAGLLEKLPSKKFLIKKIPIFPL
jgi:ribokinase